MSIGASFSILFCSSILICVTGLRWCALEFIYNDTAVMWSDSMLTYLVTFILLGLFLAIALKIIQPFDRTIKRIKTTGERASDAEIHICLLCYRKLNIVVTIANILGFFVGQLAVTLISYKVNGTPFLFSRFFLVIAQATGFGMVSCISTINGMDAVLSPMRRMLRVRSLKRHKKARYLNIEQSIILTAFCILFFVAMNMFSIYYGDAYSLQFEGAGIQGMTTHIFKKGWECMVISFAFSIFPAFVLISGINARIKTTAAGIEDITERGDLTQRIDITMIDDFGMLITEINTLITRLSSMIGEVKEGAVSIADSAMTLTESSASATLEIEDMNDSLKEMRERSAAQNELIQKTDISLNELADNFDNVRQSVVSQTDAMKQITRAMAEMSESISSVADIAYKAQNVSVNLSDTSNTGVGSIQNAITSMGQIQESSEEVQSIIRVIKKIASQTNLLAMNAAIEAAHAGDVGAGFAVVADEVRSLAESSQKSAKEIQSRIKDMSARIEAGVKAISEAGDAFRNITGRVIENGELVKTIYESMERQKTGALETEKVTQEALVAVNCVQALTESEAVNAGGVRGFMKEVVEAAKQTDYAIELNTKASESIRGAVAAVSEAVVSNAGSVQRMKAHVDSFNIEGEPAAESEAEEIEEIEEGE